MSTISVSADKDNNTLVLSSSEIEDFVFEMDSDAAWAFLNAVYDACLLIGVVESVKRKRMH